MLSLFHTWSTLPLLLYLHSWSLQSASMLWKNLACGSRSKNGDAEQQSDDAEQERMMNTEHCILVDEDDNVIGHDSKKNCHLMANGLAASRVQRVPFRLQESLVASKAFA